MSIEFYIEIELRMRDLMLGGQFFCEIWENYVALSYSSFFGCFQWNRCRLLVKKLHRFHNIPLFRVSWGEMRFWAVSEENGSLSKISVEHQSFTWNSAQNERFWCLEDNSNVKICLAYSSWFGSFQCNACVSVKQLHLY